MRFLLLSVFVFFGTVFSSSSLDAQDSALDLMLQVQRLNQWLSPSPYSEGWRRYLLLNQLESQAIKGWRGDAQVVKTILRQFESAQPGLEHPVFDRVRQSLRAHSQQLPYANADMQTAIDNALANFAPVTPERVRAEAINLQTEVMLCRNQYMLYRADAASICADLRFDELLNTVAGLDLTPAQPSQPANKRQSDDSRVMVSILLHLNQRALRYRDQFLPIVRRQLERTVLQYSQLLKADQQAEFKDHLGKVTEKLAAVGQWQQRTAQGEMALELGWLDATGHAPQVVTAIRARLMQPNARFLVTESLMQRLGSRPVNNQRPVNEVILGRQIYGTATTTGSVQLDLVDDPDQAHVSIHMMGNTMGNSHTHQGPVTAYSGSYANVEARRSILANFGGLIEFAPYVAANLNSDFRGVNCIPLVEKFAYKQYQRDKNASEAIAARRAEQKLLNEFGRESDDAIRKAKDRLVQAQRKLNEQNDQSFPLPPLYVRTTDDYLLGYGLGTNTFGLSALNAPPESVSVPADVVVQVHESILENYLEPVLARQTFKNVELPQKLKEWFGDRVKTDLIAPSSEDIWGITLAPSRPVQFIFEDNRFGVAIAGSKFTRNDTRKNEQGAIEYPVRETIDEPMAIKVMFKMQRDQGQLKLERDGLATVEFTREGTKSVPKNAFRSFLQDVLNKNLREQEKPADSAAKNRIPANLIPAERLQDPTVAQNMELVVFRSEFGWVTAAWRYSSVSMSNSPNGVPAVRVLGPIDTPAIQDVVNGAAPAQ